MSERTPVICADCKHFRDKIYPGFVGYYTLGLPPLYHSEPMCACPDTRKIQEFVRGRSMFPCAAINNDGKCKHFQWAPEELPIIEAPRSPWWRFWA